MDLVERLRLLVEPAGGDQRSATGALLAALSNEDARCLRLCAIPHEFDLMVLRVLAPELRENEARERLAGISALSCVRTAPDGFALHDATRRELFDGWLRDGPRAEFEGASRRLAAHFESAVVDEGKGRHDDYVYAHVFHLLGADQASGFARFELLCREARHQMQFAVCDRLVRLVREYEAALTPERRALLDYHEGKLALDVGRSDEAEDLFRKVLRDETVAGEQLACKARLRLGHILAQRRDFAHAVGEYLIALDAYPRFTEPHAARAYRILLSLGEAYRDMGKISEAEQALLRSRSEAAAVGDEGAVADAYNSLGTLQLRKGDVEDAIRSFEESLARLAHADRLFQAARVYNNLGLAYAQRAIWDHAEHCYAESLAIKQRAGDTLGQARTLLNLAYVHAANGHLDKALASADTSFAQFSAMRNLLGMGHAQKLRGRLFLKKRSVADAMRAFSEAKSLFTQSGDAGDAGTIEAEMAAVPGIGFPAWFIALLVLAGLLFVCFVSLIVWLITSAVSLQVPLVVGLAAEVGVGPMHEPGGFDAWLAAPVSERLVEAVGQHPDRTGGPPAPARTLLEQLPHEPSWSRPRSPFGSCS
jgi:tetratricopeptide (TPR) repeat protein